MEISSSSALYARQSAQAQYSNRPADKKTESKPEEDPQVKNQQQKLQAEAALMSSQQQAESVKPKPVVNAQGQTTGQLVNVTA